MYVNTYIFHSCVRSKLSLLTTELVPHIVGKSVTDPAFSKFKTVLLHKKLANINLFFGEETIPINSSGLFMVAQLKIDLS